MVLWGRDAEADHWLSRLLDLAPKRNLLYFLTIAELSRIRSAGEKRLDWIDEFDIERASVENGHELSADLSLPVI